MKNKSITILFAVTSVFSLIGLANLGSSEAMEKCKKQYSHEVCFNIINR